MKQEFINVLNIKNTILNKNNEKYETDDNFTFEDLPMVFQVLLERTIKDEKGKMFYDNCSLFWTKINKINSS